MSRVGVASARLAQFLRQRRLCTSSNKNGSTAISVANNRSFDSNSEAFEYERQKLGKVNIQKIVVKVTDHEGNAKSFLMNKNISTPFDVACHISSVYADSLALCIVRGDDEALTSLHEPLTQECEIEFISFHSYKHSDLVNEAFWRSSSLLLGNVLHSAFATPTQLIGADDIDFRRGFFTYDVRCDALADWTVEKKDLASLAVAVYSDLISKSLPFEVLRLPQSSCANFYAQKSESSDDQLLLCRLGEVVEKIRGPVVSHAGQIGRFAIVKASEEGGIWRFSGVALPASQPISSYNWSLITERARKASP